MFDLFRAEIPTAEPGATASGKALPLAQPPRSCEAGPGGDARSGEYPIADCGPVGYAYGGSRSISTPTSCISVGVANGVRGGMIGAGFGAVFAMASPPPMASASAIAAHCGQAAMRNAAGFASWTCIYGFARCELVRIRRTNDLFNPLIAGFATGAALSLATIPRGHWRYARQSIVQNAAGSALIACVFDIANRI